MSHLARECAGVVIGDRPKRADYRFRLQFFCVGPSMAKQSFKAECDINNIMKRYEKTGMLSHVNQYQGQYGDFTDNFDFHESINRVHAARDMFMTLPASIRSEFRNDAGLFLDFVSDPKNEGRMRELGLLKAPPVPPVVKDVVENPPAKQAAPTGGSNSPTSGS